MLFISLITISYLRLALLISTIWGIVVISYVMDALEHKRRQAQSPSHTTINPLGITAAVPKGHSLRPTVVAAPGATRIVRPIASVPARNRRPSVDGMRNRMRTPAPAAPGSPATPASPFTAVPVAAVTPAPHRIPAFDMDLPGEPSPSLFERSKAHNIRRMVFRGAAVGLVLLITTGGLLVSQTLSKTNKVFSGSTGTVAALKKDVVPELLKGEGAGRINVLLLGRGGGMHSAPDLTDTIIIASIDPINHTSTMFSVPRDLWVAVPRQGVMKLNAAWQTGEFKYIGRATPGSTDPKAVQAGFDLVDETLEGVLGIKIDYNVMVNFDAFKQAVDTVSGVNVNVPTDLVDPTMAWENANDPVLAHAGAQLFDGKKALTYVRSRETSSDFARGERQRAVMLALKDKMDSLGTLSNPIKLSGLVSAFGNNVQTDLSIKDASRLYGITKQVSDTSTTSVGLADAAAPLVTTGNINGQSVVLPKAGLFKYDAITAFVRSQLKDPYIVKENAKVLVLNGSTVPGTATARANELKSFGYNVVGAANTPNSGWTHTTVIDLSKNHKKYTRNYLQKRFNVKAASSMPDDTIGTNGADFVIIIGSDEANLTQN